MHNSSGSIMSALSRKEKNMVMSSEDSSSYPDDSGLELGLGLSLGGGGKSTPRPPPPPAVADGGGSWYQYARILTAKDFPSSSSSPVTKNNNNNGCSAASQVAGWPPIGIYRMSSLVKDHAKSPATEESTSTDDKCKSTNIDKINYSGKRNNNVAKERGLVKTSLFVKVNMDGISIGRKIDLNAHSCYETLARTLDQMFTHATVGARRSNVEKQFGTERPARLLDGSSDFVLTYEDKDGDWMLVGDVPWEMFLSSVRRLRIRRTSEANGLAPRSHERNGRQLNTPI